MSNSGTKKRAVIVLVYGILLISALLMITPLLFMFIGSLKPDDRILVEAGSMLAFFPNTITIDNYQNVFERATFFRYLFNSLFITTCIVLLGLIFNSMAAYAFARMLWSGREVLLLTILAVMIIPLEAIAVPLFYQVTVFGWRDTYFVQIIPFIANAFSIYLFYSFFISLPRELEEAAHLDGAGTIRTFIQIIVPNAKPVFATVTILTFLTQWSSFLWPLMVTSSESVRPLPLGIAMFFTLPPLQWGDILAFGMMMVLPVLVVFIIFQKWFVRGVTATGIKG